jgi:ankyrin repeat protein
MSIHELAKAGDVSAVLAELSCGTAVDARDPQTDRTALMEAAASPEAGVEMLRLLIDRGADVNAVAGPAESEQQDQLLAHLVQLTKAAQAKDPAAMPHVPPGMQEAMEQMLASRERRRQGGGIKETVLSLAIRSGEIDKVCLMLEAGADVRYQRNHGYGALIDAAALLRWTDNAAALPMLTLMIERGAPLDFESDWRESALSIASHCGRFDAVRLLLDAESDPAPLEWTPLMKAVALGTLDDVEEQLRAGADLAARDFWDRTAWLLSLQTRDLSKAKRLLATGADRSDRGRCGKSPLEYPIDMHDAAMLRWLLSEGFDPNDVPEGDNTPLIVAAGEGAAECVAALLEAGAAIDRVGVGSATPIKSARNLKVVRLLVARGADLTDINDDTRAALTRQPHGRPLRVSRQQYAAGRSPRFGTANPQRIDEPLWNEMIASGRIAWDARRLFGDDDAACHNGPDREPVWCFHRYGRTVTELPDRRVVEIAGEHEDYYDPDFCIYNDVVVHHGDGSFDVYAYPRDAFPPTDFHTATVVGGVIYVIGNLGYPRDRRPGFTPVHRLDVLNWRMEAVETSGEMPGWISNHRASLRGDEIWLTGGKVMKEAGKLQENDGVFVLDLKSRVWRHDQRRS